MEFDPAVILNSITDIRRARNKWQIIQNILYVISILSLTGFVLNLVGITQFSPYLILIISLFTVILICELAVHAFLNIFQDNKRSNYTLPTNLEDILTSWTFQGTLRLEDGDNSMVLTDSDAGAIVRGLFWKDFHTKFQAKIDNESGFAFLFHAKSLDEYLMLKFDLSQGPAFHLRQGRAWEILRGEPIKLPLRINEWNDFEISLKGRKVNISINSYAYSYIIANRAILNAISISPGEPIASQGENRLTIPINLNGGSIGFRTFGTERVAIRRFYVEHLA